jgi:hypothetical protein
VRGAHRGLNHIPVPGVGAPGQLQAWRRDPVPRGSAPDVQTRVRKVGDLGKSSKTSAQDFWSRGAGASDRDLLHRSNF